MTTKHEGSVLQSEQAWDVRGRLAGLKDGSGNWLSQYRYTPDGIRSAATEGGTTTLHVIDVLGPSGYAQVIEERTAAGVVVGSYVYGPTLDPLSQWRDGQGANLYLADGHSGVRQAVSLAGVMLLAQRFDAFGVTVASAGTLANVIGYRGERFDSTLGQYYLRARFYNPMSGRFTGMDPFAGNYGDPSQAMRHGYAGANPIGFLDPSGLFSTGGQTAVAIAVGSLLVASLGFGLVSSLKIGLMAQTQAQAWASLQPIAQTLGVKSLTYTEIESEREPGYLYFIHATSTNRWIGATGIDWTPQTAKKDFGPAFYTYNPTEPRAIPSANHWASVQANRWPGGHGMIIWVKILQSDYESLRKYDLRGASHSTPLPQWYAVVNAGDPMAGSPGFYPDIVIGPIANIANVNGRRIRTPDSRWANQYAFQAGTAGKLKVAFVTLALPRITFNQPPL